MSEILNLNEFLYHMNYNMQWGPLLNNIDVSTAQDILKAYKLSSKHTPMVCIEGDSIINNPTKVFQTLDLCAKYNFSIDFKTNCNWVNTDNSGDIFNIFEKFFKYHKTACFTFVMPLDDFYDKNPNHVIKFMDWFANTPIISDNTYAQVVQNNVNTLVRFLIDLIEKNNIMANYYPQQQRFQYMPMFQMGDKNRFFFQQEKKDINNTDCSVVRNISNVNEVKNIAFNKNGNATLFNPGNTAVSVPYTKVNGAIKPIKQIKQELFNMAYQQYLTETK